MQVIGTTAIYACAEGFEVALERAADPLHRAHGNAKPRGNLAHTLRVPRLASHLILPEMFEPIGRQRGVAHRGHNAAVAKVVLDSTGILAIISQLVAAAMAQHVAMNEKAEPGRLARPRNAVSVQRRW